MSDYVARGVRSKLYTLLRKFDEEKTLRYNVFTQHWRSMKFPLIFSDRRELPEFTEEILNIAKEFTLTTHNLMPFRVGGLYALYGLYLKQPIRPQIKIRMTLDEWRTLQEFISTMRICKHYDVVYIYTQLMKLNAFHHCATAQQEEYAFVDGWEWGNKENVLLCPRSTGPWGEVIDSIQLHMQQYYDAKCNIKGGNGKTPPTLLNYVQCNSTKRVADAIEKILKSEEKDDSHSSSENDDSGLEDDVASDPSYDPYRKNNPRRPSNNTFNKRQRTRYDDTNHPSQCTWKGSTSDPSEDENKDVSQLIKEFEDLVNDVMGKPVEVNVTGSGSTVLYSLDGYEDIPQCSQQGNLSSCSTNITLELGKSTNGNGTGITTQLESLSISCVRTTNKDWDKDIREIASMDPLVTSERSRKLKRGTKSSQKRKGCKETPSTKKRVPRKPRQNKTVSFLLKASNKKLKKSSLKMLEQPRKGILKKRVPPTYAEGTVQSRKGILKKRVPPTYAEGTIQPRKEILKKRGPRSSEERLGFQENYEAFIHNISTGTSTPGKSLKYKKKQVKTKIPDTSNARKAASRQRMENRQSTLEFCSSK